MFHRFRLRFRRKYRRSLKQINEYSHDSGDSFERHVIQRFGRLNKVWRFVAAWVTVSVLLIVCLGLQLQALGSYYQTRKPVPGGVYTEGVVGTFSNANPVYAVNDVDKSVSRLVFAGLFRYNDQNKLVGDLAKSWSADKAGTTYTIKLRPNLTWHDGEPLTARDVAFTYRVIQHPDAASPLRGSWQGITVRAVDAQTVTFKLPNPLSSFIYGMTNGIIPEHLLKDIPMVGMRSSSFNTQNPVGAGAFRWRDIEVKGSSPADAEESIGLSAFADYWAGAPKLRSFVVHAYADRAAMIDAYRQHELTAMSGLKVVPDELAKDSVVTSFPLTAATMVFFKTSQGVLKNTSVRTALVQAVDQPKVLSQLGYDAQPVQEPLLKGQLGYADKYAQQTGQPAEAQAALEKAGWQLQPDSTRAKDGERLQFSLTIPNTAEYTKVAAELQRQWRAIGADARIDPQDPAIFRNSLKDHTYDSVLYGIAIGVDPDVFVYWDSSQADVRSSNRLNLSEYESATVDDALDGGRTRLNPTLRTIKYGSFLEQWQKDVPALGLYQPRYLYISHGPVYGLERHPLNEAADRMFSAHEWMIRTARVTNE